MQAQPAGAAISLPSTTAPPGAEKVTVFVRGVRIVGATVYTTEDFNPLVAEMTGRRVPLTAIYDLAGRITAKYGKDGYVLSRAIVPPQQLDPKGSVIRIDVIEGYVDKVEWPATLSHYRDFFSYYARRITADRPINIRTLERYLLLAGDLPGLEFATRLKPSERNRGASTLVVEVAQKWIDITGRVDNRGTHARGPMEFLSSVTLNNWARSHEALSLTYAGVSQLKELQYIAGNYRQVLTAEGLTLFADASYTWGKPGTVQLETLQYRNLGPYADVGLMFPLIRLRERNLSISGLAFASDNRADMLGVRFNDDRLRGVRARADADLADPWGGVNQFYAIASQGIEAFGSTENDNPLASRAAGRIDFSKVEGYASRTQALFNTFSAFAAVYSQYAFTPLLSPEQCGYGGRFFGRAFDPSQLLGDSCVEVVGELRYDVPLAPTEWFRFSQFQFYGFTDYGRVWTRAPAVGTPRSQDGASAGTGVRIGYEAFGVDLQAAKAVEGPLNDWRFFFIAGMRF